MPKVLIYHANSVQGGAVVEYLKSTIFQCRVMIRNESKIHYFKQQGIEVAIADLMDKEAVANAHENIDYAIVHIPAYGDDFVKKAINNALYAIELHKIKGFIVKLSNPIPQKFIENSGFSTSKIILDQLSKTKIPYCIVEPTMYLDTLLKPNFIHEISQKSIIELPLSSQLKIAWTSVDNVAEITINLLEQYYFKGIIRCASSIAIDGNQLAYLFSKALKKDIRFESVPLDSFQKEIINSIGSQNARPVIEKFKFLHDYPVNAERMLSAQTSNSYIQNKFEIENWIYKNRYAWLL